MRQQAGSIVLLGSGETSPTIRKVYDELFRPVAPPVRIAILETPAGFEPNSDYVAGQIRAYLEKHLQNYRPAIDIIPARKRGTSFSPDDPALLDPLFAADFLFMGPGSPTYAARQLRDSVAWQSLQACHRLGASLIFASATTIACSRLALPIYEIYKVGEELHWKPGLDFFGPFGLDLIFVPHWNNNDGGAVLDTSHCYIGAERYGRMLDLLPTGADAPHAIVGIDENTALVVDPHDEVCHVRGVGGVTLVRDGDETRFDSGVSFGAHELGPFRLPEGHAGIDAALWQTARRRVNNARARSVEERSAPDEIEALVAAREAARDHRKWSTADHLRAQIEAAGWQVQDTPDGPRLTQLDR